MLLTLILVSMLVFFITAVLPGNAASMILGKYATPEKIASLEAHLGLDRPVYIQYMDWLVNIATGNLGVSFVERGRPISEVIIPPAIRSAQLAAITMLSVTGVAISFGVIAAYYRNTKIDVVLSGVSYIGVSIPEFVTGTFLIVLFAGPVFGFFPAGGHASLVDDGIIAWARHIVLPVITMSILLTAHMMRLTRSEVIETLHSDYVRAARLKGLNEKTVLIKHALRNGLLPTITQIAMNFGFLLGGLVVVEVVFAYPGLGELLVAAVLRRDVPLIQAIVMIIATVYVFANFLADVAYSLLDPRISLGEAAE